jgi:hypothetical protein
VCPDTSIYPSQNHPYAIIEHGPRTIVGKDMILSLRKYLSRKA